MRRLEDMSSAELARAATRRRVNEEYLVNANADMGRELTKIHKRFPHLNAATAMALAEAGYKHDSTEVTVVGKLQAKRDRDQSVWGRVKSHWQDSVENHVKPVVRTGLTALGAPYEAVQGSFRSGLQSAREGDVRGALAPLGAAGLLASGKAGEVAKQTRLGAAVQVAHETGLSVPAVLNNNPQVGRDGDVTALLEREQQTWLPGTNSLAEKRQVANARNAGMVNGRATTFGRAAGYVVGFQPGGAAYRLMNGMMEFTSAAGNPMLDDQADRDAMIGTAQRLFEGGIDVTAALSPLDPIGKLSAGRSRQAARAGQFGGRTVEVTTPVRQAPEERMVRVFRGSTEPLDLDRIGEDGIRVTTDLKYAEEYGGTRYLYEVEIPESKLPRTAMGDALGEGPLPHTRLSRDEMRRARVVREPGRADLPGPTGPDVPILVDSHRKTVVFQNAADWLLKSKHGDRFARYAAAEDNYERLATVLGREVPPSTVLRVLDAKDPVTAKAVLVEEMGKGFVSKQPSLSSADLAAVGEPASRVASIAAATFRRPTARWRQLRPSETIVSREDPAWAVEQYRRMLHAMRVGRARDVLTPEFVAKNVEDFARGIVDDTADWSVPYKAATDAARTALIASGTRRGDADFLTRIWQQRITSERHFWIDRHTGAVKTAFATVDGDDLPLAKAAASAEAFTDGIPLLNTTEFARAASRLNRLYQNKGWEAAVSIGDAGTAFFKFLVLPVRGPAWMMRNLAEAQARVTVEGLDGVMNSPLSALAWRVGDNPRSAASRLLGRRAREEGRGVTDAAGDDFRLRAELEDNANKFARAQEHKGGPWTDDQLVVYSDEYGVVRRDEPGGYDAWLAGNRFTLAKLSASPEYRMAVDAESPLHAKNMFWNSKVRARWAQREPQLATREGADAFMDRVYERIQDVTGGNPVLTDAIRTGKVNGIPLKDRNAAGNLVHNEKVLDELDKHADDLPDYTVTQKSQRMSGSGNAISKGAEALERTVFRQGFALFGSMPNNRFVNSPTFRQLHWQDAVRLAPLATADARKALVVNARKANMPKALIRQLEEVTGPAGTLDVADVRDLADARAFERWMDIVYNSHNKGNWTHSVRMLSPFAAAVADMYRFWGKRLARNPLVLHRVEQGMHGARQSGTFYTDDNGEERFAYPLTRGLSQAVAGVDRAFTGTVKGANMITSSVLPSLGPVATWPAAMLLPDRKETDDLREIINPYGDPDASGGLLEGLAPGHVQRILAAVGLGSAEQKRRYQESVADTMAYLASTGRYGNSEAEQRRLREDAKGKGRLLYLVQAFAQSSLPASPRGDTYYQDPSGRALQIAHIAADYRRMMTEDPDTATQNLYQKYGDAVFLAVTGGTAGTALATEEAHDLAREHPAVVEKYGAVWSFFTDPNSPYSHEEFRRQLATQERIPKTMRERQQAAQTSLASSMYHQYKEQFGPFPSPEERAYLQQVKTKIREQLPLWDESYDVNAGREKVKQALAAAADPVFRDSDVAQAVLAYGQARAQVAEHYNSIGVTSSETGWGRAKAAEEGRDYLRQVAASLIEQVPEFETMWQRVFDAEMVDDVEGQP